MHANIKHDEQGKYVVEIGISDDDVLKLRRKGRTRIACVAEDNNIGPVQVVVLLAFEDEGRVVENRRQVVYRDERDDEGGDAR